MYGGVQISYEAGWGDVDIPTKWAALARDQGGSVQTIGGRLAYIHPPSKTGPRGSVMMVEDETLIRLLAEADVPIETLTELASTIP